MGSLQGSVINEREKAAVRLHVYGQVEDWRLLYALAGGTDGNTPKTTTHYISKWKNSVKVQAEIDAQRREKYADDQRLKERLREEIEEEQEKRGNEGGSEPPKKAARRSIDYTDPRNQREKLNQLVNEAEDAGEALDALKVIISGQRDDRQAAKEGKQVRAYLPISCKDCPLYQKQRQKLTI